MKNNEIGGECSTYGGQEWCIQGFGGGDQGRRSLGRHRQKWEDNIKMDLQEVRRGRGLD